MNNRIMITGLGVVSPIGNTLDVFWGRLLEGSMRPTEYEQIAPTHCENRLFYAVPKEFDKSGVASGRATSFAIQAIQSALVDAGLSPSTAFADSVIGVSIGTAMGNQDLFDHERAGGHCAIPFQDFCYYTSAHVAGHFNFHGPNYSISTACSSGAYSVSVAKDAISQGLADVMVVGGTETGSLVPFGCFNQMRALDPKVCRPFDSERLGTVGGEGAAILILESEAHWRNRGAPRAYAMLNESGWTCDGHHVTAPAPGGEQLRFALLDALERSGVGPDEVDCVVAHGTGTRLNDQEESQVIRNVLYTREHRPHVFAIKSQLGHSGGAAGAFSCLAGALIIHHDTIPPTVNLTKQDDECQLEINSVPLSAAVRHVVVNSYAFGGNNISLILSKVENAS